MSATECKLVVRMADEEFCIYRAMREFVGDDFFIVKRNPYRAVNLYAFGHGVEVTLKMAVEYARSL